MKSPVSKSAVSSEGKPDPDPEAAGPRSGADIGLEQTMVNASSLPPEDRDPGTAPAPAPVTATDIGTDTARDPSLEIEVRAAAPADSEPLKGFNTTPHEALDALRRSRPPPDDDDELQRGATIGRYIVVGSLGSGGMGVVYAAYDPELDRKVATKLLRASTSGGSSGQGRVRLMREAQAMARLSHPQVIGVFDVGTLGDQVFIAMEFVDGGTLTSWLEASPRTQSAIIEKFTLAGRGLAAAHAAGLVHRDFKPDNVLVGKDGRVRVMDFGLAHGVGHGDDRAEDAAVAEELLAGSRSTSGALALRLTRTGALLGTPRYMSPEQFEGKKTDPRTDQFSFCVALYEALYKVPPFAGDNLAMLGFNVVQGQVCSPPPEPKVPTWIRQVLLRGLSVRPADRFPTMEALLEALHPQRRKVSKSWLVTGVVLALAIISNLGYRQVQQRKVALCQGADHYLVGIWEPERKETLKKAMLGTGQRFAADSWQEVAQTLDAYTRDWVTMRTEACNSTVHGDQGKVIHDLRMRCLDRRLDEVSAVTSILSRPDETIIESAASAAHNLTPLSGCANLEALTAPTPIPDNPMTRKRVEQVSKQLDEIRAMKQFGKFSEVRKLAEAAVSAAAATKYRPAEAEALFLLGEILDSSGLAQQAEELLLHGASAAIEGRDQRVVARTWILLVQVTGFHLREYSKAMAWAQLADATLDLINDPEPLRSQLLLARCMVASQAGYHDQAIESCQQSLVLRQKIYGKESFETSEVMLTMAGVYRHIEQFPRAMELYQKALALQTHYVGPFHPNVRSATRGIGLLLREQHKYAEADTYFRKSLETASASLGPQHIRTTDYQILLVINLLSQNKLSEAEQMARSCLEVIEHPTPPYDDPTRQSQAQYFLGEVLQRKGHYTEALQHYTTALQIREKMPVRQESQIAYTLNAMGETLAAMGKLRDGLPYMERALNYRESRRTSDHASQQAQQAQQALGRSEFSLAKTLWQLGRKDQRKRALLLARRAQLDYEQYGQHPDNDLPQVVLWIAERNPAGTPAAADVPAAAPTEPTALAPTTAAGGGAAPGTPPPPSAAAPPPGAAEKSAVDSP